MESGIWEVDDATYYGDTDHVSASMLEVFRQSVPTFAARFIDCTLPAPEPTPAMRFGTLFHRAVLEPERFADTVAVAPKCNRRTKAGKSQWATFQALNAGRDILEQEDYDRIRSMAASIRDHPVAGLWHASDSRCELAIRWDDLRTGLPCKGKIDLLNEHKVIVDFKTAADPTPAEFGWACVNYGYHRRAAHYLAGAELLGLATRYIFVAVGKEPPHEVGVYELDGQALELGQEQVRALLAEMSERNTAGNWSSRMAGGIQPVALPRWAFAQS